MANTGDIVFFEVKTAWLFWKSVYTKSFKIQSNLLKFGKSETSLGPNPDEYYGLFMTSKHICQSYVMKKYKNLSGQLFWVKVMHPIYGAFYYMLMINMYFADFSIKYVHHLY